jgi:hypothetical protein
MFRNLNLHFQKVRQLFLNCRVSDKNSSSTGKYCPHLFVKSCEAFLPKTQQHSSPKRKKGGKISPAASLWWCYRSGKTESLRCSFRFSGTFVIIFVMDNFADPAPTTIVSMTSDMFCYLILRNRRIVFFTPRVRSKNRFIPACRQGVSIASSQSLLASNTANAWVRSGSGKVSDA